MKTVLHYERGHDGYLFEMVARQPGSKPQPHMHEELELNLVVSGRGSYKLGDGRYELRRNSLIWLFPGQDHVLVDYSAGFAMWVLVFNNSCVARHGLGDAAVLGEENPKGTFCRTLQNADALELQQLFSKIAGLEKEANAFNAGLDFAMALSWMSFKRASEMKAVSELHPAVEKALMLLDKGGGELKIEELAKEAGISASRLSRLFNKQLGVSIPQFKNNVRMRTFDNLICAPGGISLSEAAIRAGFGSYVQFHRVFKELSGGTSPLQMKRGKAVTPR